MLSISPESQWLRFAASDKRVTKKICGIPVKSKDSKKPIEFEKAKNPGDRKVFKGSKYGGTEGKGKMRGSGESKFKRS